MLSTGYPQNNIVINPPNINFLKRPTGPYRVGFEDFHWINQNVCPDFNFNGKNQDDFSPDNSKHCHEIVARIYYPTASKKQSYSSYYPPFVNATLQEIQASVPNIPNLYRFCRNCTSSSVMLKSRLEKQIVLYKAEA